MNREVLYLVAVFVVGCVAITFRAIMFNLAGEQFVARLRKQVHNNQPFFYLMYICMYLVVVFFNYQARNGLL